jgi:AcrR family transcriptional regulator
MPNRKNSRARRRPRQDRSRATVESIVIAAERVVAREGTRRATTNRIAEVAGVSVGSLYQYFPNKEALVETLRDRSGEDFAGVVQAHVDSLTSVSLRDRVRGLVDLLIQWHRQTLALHNALVAHDEGFHETIETRWLPFVVAHLEANRAELRPANLALAARIALEVVEALTHGAALRAPELLDDPEYAAEVTDLVYRYLAK